jgi:hypothetical protein
MILRYSYGIAVWESRGVDLQEAAELIAEEARDFRTEYGERMWNEGPAGVVPLSIL